MFLKELFSELQYVVWRIILRVCRLKNYPQSSSMSFKELSSELQYAV